MFTRIACLVALLFLSGCGLSGKSEETLPRAAPGYLHWLHQQSMLGKAPELIATVSQSHRVWLNSGEGGRPDVLLKAAPNWLDLAVIPDNPQKPFFRELTAEVANAGRMGFGGVYLGQTGEKADVWVSRDGKGSSRKPVSFAFDAAFGSDADFEKLAGEAEASNLQLGSDFLAGATGRGPDFFLQARNASEHGGLYAMLPVPDDAEELLSLTHEEWDSEEITPRLVSDLAAKGILPGDIARDGVVWTSKGGWACTGPVLGADGKPRRWLYRYSETPDQPVLSWQDPSGQTARVISAAAIRQTGLLGETLAGLSFEPLMGLDPGKHFSLSPGLAALNETSRQIHRYGGWAMQIDPLPLAAIEEVLRGPCDFCRDDITALLAAFGLVNADGRPIAQLYRDWIAQGFDVARLAHGFNAAQGLPVRTLLANPEWAPQTQRLSELGSSIKFAQIVKTIFPEPTDEQVETVRRFLLTWRLGLPGLAFVEFYPGSLAQPSDGWLEHLLLVRRDSGLACGKIISVTRGRGGALGLLTQLPERKGFWLLACNFGRMRDELVIEAPGPIASAIDAGDASSLSSGLAGRTFRIGLDGREARNVLLQIKP
ncbi:MAG: hypothetical protein HDQ44_02965 [Desulfovibrio sp.]|nr:hypothetical protein [Desulfovibrio sp.]